MELGNYRVVSHYDSSPMRDDYFDTMEEANFHYDRCNKSRSCISSYLYINQNGSWVVNKYCFNRA